MVITLVLTLAAAIGPQAGGTPNDVQPQWGPARPEAEIGEPVEWVLEVAHPRRGRPRIASESLEERLDRSWVFVSGPEILTRADATSRAEVSRFVWILMALEAGERTAPTLTLLSEAGAEVEVVSEILSVRPALAASEDAPRPFASFHEVPQGSTGFLTVVFGALIALLVAGLAVVVTLVLRARRRRRDISEQLPPAPRDAFDALVAGRGDDAPGVRALAFELTGILRAALVGGEAGATDQEWLAEARARGAAASAVLDRVESVMSSCEEIKYAGGVPTRFAIDELLAEARSALEGLEGLESVDVAGGSGATAAARETQEVHG